MTDPKPDLPGTPPAETDGRSDASVVTQFFLLPLAVVAGLVGIFLLFTLATRHPPTPRDHLRTLRSGRFNQRWQAAFELSNLLRDGRGVREDPELVQEIIRVFRESPAARDEDPRVRRYLVLAMGNSGSADAVAPLLEVARDPDAETRLYGLWGLARLGAAEAGPIFKEGLRDPDPSVRSVSAYGLGMLQEPGQIDDLKSALKDPVGEVRWNAALALGRRGDPAGEEILRSLLDREYLNRSTSMSAGEKSTTILNSLRALKHLAVNDLDDRVEALGRSDPDPQVREAARSWKTIPAN